MPIPHLSGDSSLAFLTEGYRFGQHRFDRLGTDAFSTRMMFRPVTLLRGSEAARFFYEGERFNRNRSIPLSVFHSLQDEGSVQSLTGGAHRVRKSMFLGMMSEGSMHDLAAIFRSHLSGAMIEWEGRGAVALHQEFARILTRTACEWAGIPLPDSQVETRSDEFLAMIDRAGTFGPPNWIARAKRLRTEEWARSVVSRARQSGATSGSPLAAIIDHRDADGRSLDVRTAAVELLNVVRPTVAVGRFIVFAAWALHRHPSWARRIGRGDDVALEQFVQEVRRFAPFFPAVGGRAAHSLEWNGHRFEEGDWVMLDLFATNRHPALWERPERFDPARFAVAADHNALVPQGGGGVSDGYRCPGERPTINLIADAVALLTRSVEYDVPPQDLRVSLRHLPSLPQSGFVISDVRPREIA